MRSWMDEVQTELQHYGIKGQKKGRRRYQNPDGSLTPAGKLRYLSQKAHSVRGSYIHVQDSSKSVSSGSGVKTPGPNLSTGNGNRGKNIIGKTSSVSIQKKAGTTSGGNQSANSVSKAEKNAYITENSIIPEGTPFGPQYHIDMGAFKDSDGHIATWIMREDDNNFYEETRYRDGDVVQLVFPKNGGQSYGQVIDPTRKTCTRMVNVENMAHSTAPTKKAAAASAMSSAAQAAAKYSDPRAKFAYNANKAAQKNAKAQKETSERKKKAQKSAKTTPSKPGSRKEQVK